MVQKSRARNGGLDGVSEWRQVCVCACGYVRVCGGGAAAPLMAAPQHTAVLRVMCDRMISRLQAWCCSPSISITCGTVRWCSTSTTCPTCAACPSLSSAGAGDTVCVLGWSQIFTDMLKMANYMKLGDSAGCFITEIAFVSNLCAWMYFRLCAQPTHPHT